MGSLFLRRMKSMQALLSTGPVWLTGWEEGGEGGEGGDLHGNFISLCRYRQLCCVYALYGDVSCVQYVQRVCRRLKCDW